MSRNKGREMKEVWEGRRAVPHIQLQRGHGAAMFDGGAWSKPAGSGRAGTRGQGLWSGSSLSGGTRNILGQICAREEGEEGDGNGVLNEEVKNKW